MDIKEGHPGSIFYWFFDTDQGAKKPAEILVFFVGCDQAIESLAERCIERQAMFNGALGSRVLFLFFDPRNVPAQNLVDQGRALRCQFQADDRARFLFSGMGRADPVPAELIAFGRVELRSEREGAHYFEDIAREAARSHAHAALFFQQAFGLEPNHNYLMVAHRRQQVIQLFQLTRGDNLGPDNMLNIVTRLRTIAGNPHGPGDLDAISHVVEAEVFQGVVQATARHLWTAIRPVIRSIFR